MRKWRVLAIVVGVGMLACRGGDVIVRFPGDSTGIVRPQALDSLASVVRQLNAIVMADARDISEDYDRREGPRTILHLANVRSLLGRRTRSQCSCVSSAVPFPAIATSGLRIAKVRTRREIRSLPVQHRLALFSRHLGPCLSRGNARRQEILVPPNGHAVTRVSPLTVETQTGDIVHTAGGTWRRPHPCGANHERSSTAAV